MNALSGIHLRAAVVLLAALGLPASAEMPEGKPIEHYGQLWTRSVFTTPLQRPEAPEAKLPRMPAPEAQAQLDKSAMREAERRKLSVKLRKLLPAIENASVHRARLEIEVSGPEKAIYPWLHHLHSPAEFRGLTFLRINPTKTDDTRVDCLAIFEQWFLPESNEAPEVKAGDLLPLTDLRYYPVEVLLRITQTIQGGSLRLKRVEIHNQLDEKDKPLRSIRVFGEAETLNEVNTFNRKLQESEALSAFRWRTPAPTESRIQSWFFVWAAEFDPES